MVDITLPWCTYRTTHPSGFFYYGKAQTNKVLDGSYKGSGIRYKLALICSGFEYDTWTTTVDNTFSTEAEAYAAEELLVPISLLSNPFCLNMNSGGQRGKYNTHGKLYKSINSEKRKIVKEKRLAKERAKTEQIKQLKKAIKCQATTAPNTQK